MITVTNLDFTYPGNEKPTLKGLSFSIEKGEIFGFLGPSGAGKSTTQKIINGILKNYQGSVHVLGREMRRADHSIYEHIGVAFEFPNLYAKFTALENLQLFRSFYKETAREPEKLLAMVGLADDCHTRVAAFSKGMRVRLNFVRALLNEPDILFLDEPTAGLDPMNARCVKNIILDLKKQGTTIFLTTHNMTDADELCDRVGFIVSGELIVIDSPRNLKLQHSTKTVHIEYRLDDHREHKEFPLLNIGTNQEFLNIIKTTSIETIHTGEATLEDIFIKITGQKLQ
ncbi:ABC transporter ATP-binding protein [candidate division KSB1 bacterium]|nr:ABC transporter ATP-binding protein [candidate division KSB1 bacterium]RQW04445.1 MAG: ABC transporter ATP-binding protein [candidate division KSB1 bacterium]